MQRSAKALCIGTFIRRDIKLHSPRILQSTPLWTACAQQVVAQSLCAAGRAHLGGKRSPHLPWPSSLKMSSRLSSSLSFFPRRLFFPPFPTQIGKQLKRIRRRHVQKSKQDMSETRATYVSCCSRHPRRAHSLAVVGWRGRMS